MASDINSLSIPKPPFGEDWKSWLRFAILLSAILFGAYRVGEATPAAPTILVVGSNGQPAAVSQSK